MNSSCNFELLSAFNNNKLQNDIMRQQKLDFFQDISPQMLVTTAEESVAVEALSQLGNSMCSHHIEINTQFHLPLLSCRLCNIKFRTTADLQNHQAICNGIYDRSKQLIYNNLNCTNQGETQIENQCEICGVIFNRPSSLANHMKIHNYRNFTKSDSRNPLPSINNIKTTNSWNLYFESLKTVSDEAKEAERLKPYTCAVCNKSFTRKKSLEAHLKLHSNNSMQCDNCSSDFSDKKLYRKHLINCTNPSDVKSFCANLNKHKCTKCEKKFTTKQKLQRHLWIHRKKTVLCDVCSNIFETNNELNLHRLSIHSLNSAFTCKDCGKFFGSRQGLWEHSRTHSAKAAIYECNICTKTFLSRQGYLIHKRIHSNERPYGCKFCWKAFRDGGTLRKHERIHTGERPHGCPLCPKTFNQRVILREHIRWLHCANCVVNADGVIDCPLCEQVIGDKDELCVHILKHSDEMAKILIENGKN